MDSHWKNIWNSVLSGVIAGIILLIIPRESVVKYVGGTTQLTIFGLILIAVIFYILKKNR